MLCATRDRNIVDPTPPPPPSIPTHPDTLGEHGEWEKKSNFDVVVRVPLIIHVPSKVHSQGKVTTSYIDLVDVFPTLSALAGLLPPQTNTTDGNDMSSLFDDPNQMLKTEAFHQYPACGMTQINMTRDSCNNVPSNQFNYMGYSIRNVDWRYTAWYEWDQSTLKPLWDGDQFIDELYTHTGDDSSDMDKWENVNVAAANPTVTALLKARLRTFFQQS